MKTITMTLLSATLLNACVDSVNSSLPDSQKQLCSIVSESRDQYHREARKSNYIDKKKNLDAIVAERDKKLKTALGDGQVEGWKGRLDGISTVNDETHISIKLSCGAGLETGEIFFIKQETPVYEALRPFQENNEVFVTGRLTHSYDVDRLRLKQHHFDERRITQAGSMSHPDFLFIVEGIGKTAEESKMVAQAQRQISPTITKSREQIIAEREKSLEECKKNIKCISTTLISDVEDDCKRLIRQATQARASYEYDLDDGLFSSMFERARWKNSQKKEIVFYGNKARFQNGTGAWEDNEYACVVDIDKKQIVHADYIT